MLEFCPVMFFALFSASIFTGENRYVLNDYAITMFNKSSLDFSTVVLSRGFDYRSSNEKRYICTKKATLARWLFTESEKRISE